MLGKSTHGWTAVFLAASTLVLVGMMLPARSCAQDSTQTGSSGSVADAARKSREDKKNAPKDKKVYTDDDVRPAPASASSSPSAVTPSADASPGTGETPAEGQKGPADADRTAATGAAAAPPNKNDEKAWRARFQAQRDQIARAEKELDVLQREEEKAQVQYYPDPQKALEEGYSRKD